MHRRAISVHEQLLGLIDAMRIPLVGLADHGPHRVDAAEALWIFGLMLRLN